MRPVSWRTVKQPHERLSCSPARAHVRLGTSWGTGGGHPFSLSPPWASTPALPLCSIQFLMSQHQSHMRRWRKIERESSYLTYQKLSWDICELSGAGKCGRQALYHGSCVGPLEATMGIPASPAVMIQPQLLDSHCFLPTFSLFESPQLSKRNVEWHSWSFFSFSKGNTHTRFVLTESGITSRAWHNCIHLVFSIYPVGLRPNSLPPTDSRTAISGSLSYSSEALLSWFKMKGGFPLCCDVDTVQFSTKKSFSQIYIYAVSNKLTFAHTMLVRDFKKSIVCGPGGEWKLHFTPIFAVSLRLLLSNSLFEKFCHRVLDFIRLHM